MLHNYVSVSLSKLSDPDYIVTQLPTTSFEENDLSLHELPTVLLCNCFSLDKSWINHQPRSTRSLKMEIIPQHWIILQSIPGNEKRQQFSFISFFIFKSFFRKVRNLQYLHIFVYQFAYNLSSISFTPSLDTANNFN